MSHIGWNNKETSLYYMKLAEVLRVGSPFHFSSADSSATSVLVENYMELNRLKNFVSAFHPLLTLILSPVDTFWEF